MQIPSSQELFQLQQSLQNDADWVLEKIQLLPTLAKYGQVHVVGAKALNLLIDRDIDISVVVPKLRLDDWAELVKDLMKTPSIRRVTAIDYYHYDKNHRYNPANGEKYSLYVSMEKLLGQEQDESKSWECQVHLIEADKFDTSMLAKIQQQLTEENRASILRLKYWAHEVNKVLKEKSNGNFKIPSMEIYAAVLEKGITRVSDLAEEVISKLPEKFKSLEAIIRNHLLENAETGSVDR